jgi:hypothetical protein
MFMAELNEQVIQSFKKFYAEEKKIIEYACNFGSASEKAKASYIKEIALL